MIGTLLHTITCRYSLLLQFLIEIVFRLVNFCKQNNFLKINVNKTKTMVVTKEKEIRLVNLKLDMISTEQVKYV